MQQNSDTIYKALPDTMQTLHQTRFLCQQLYTVIPTTNYQIHFNDEHEKQHKYSAEICIEKKLRHFKYKQFFRVNWIKMFIAGKKKTTTPLKNYEISFILFVQI